MMSKKLKHDTNVLSEIETHPFSGPLFQLMQRVIIIGSFPVEILLKKLNEDDWFYGTKRNQFWNIISGVY